MLRLGLFSDFKLCDAAVLLAADTAGLTVLVDSIAWVAARPDTSMDFTDFCQVSAKHSVRFYLSTLHESRAIPSTGYSLPLLNQDAGDIRDKLSPLMSSNSGHQYFDLRPPTAVLVISVGEYDDGWWHSVDA
jgi:hypothetical protein